MKKFSSILCAFLGVCLTLQTAKAEGFPSGLLATVVGVGAEVCVSNDEKLQRFWHDYYDAIRLGYGTRDSVDWESYYKRDESKRQFLQPIMLWSVPNSALNGPPANLSSGMMMMPH